MELQRGCRVKVMVDGRHDFIRSAEVLHGPRNGEIAIRYDSGGTEEIPERWVRNTIGPF